MYTYAQASMLQLAIMNHRLLMLDDEVQARQRRGPNDSGSGHGYPQTEGCNLDTTTNYLSRVHLHNLHPGANLLPGAKLRPGAKDYVH